MNASRILHGNDDFPIAGSLDIQRIGDVPFLVFADGMVPAHKVICLVADAATVHVSIDAGQGGVVAQRFHRMPDPESPGN